MESKVLGGDAIAAVKSERESLQKRAQLAKYGQVMPTLPRVPKGHTMVGYYKRLGNWCVGLRKKESEMFVSMGY